MEGKDIFSQRSSLIAEYILYLPELLIEGSCSSIDLALSPHGIHELVKIYEVTLGSLGDFDGDYKRNWDA